MTAKEAAERESAVAELIDTAVEVANDLGNEALAAMDEAGEEFIAEAAENDLPEEEANVVLTVAKIIALRRAMDTIYADIEDDMAKRLRAKIDAMAPSPIPVPEAAEEGDDEEEDDGFKVDETPTPATPAPAPKPAPTPFVAPTLKKK